MTTNHSLTLAASHIIRMYLWSKLQANLGHLWSEIETKNGYEIPILPAQEQPEAQSSEKPYMVYVYDYNATSDLFQYQNETLMLRIYSQSPATIAATTKLIMRLLNKFDISAQEINAWIMDTSPNGLGGYAASGKYESWMDDIQNYRFKVVKISGIQGTQPAAGEYGRVDSLVTIELEYIEIDMGVENTNPVGP